MPGPGGEEPKFEFLRGTLGTFGKRRAVPWWRGCIPAQPNTIRCRERLGGLLKHYYSDAA
jgi:hypothetical protein